MTPSFKGDFGEVAIIKELLRQGLSVFPQFGNSSRVDMVCMDESGHLYKIQCKCTTSVDGVARLNLRKTTLDPKYNYHYGIEDVDVFAVYVEDWDRIAFIKTQEVFQNVDRRRSVSFRRTDPSGRCQHQINMITKYEKFPRGP